MRPSHPPTLITLARRVFERETELRAGAHILVATSGGPDSMALLHVLAKLRTPLRITISAHGVDHGLRAEAKVELDLAERFAQTLHVPFARTEIHLQGTGNLQARAREGRYVALRNARKAAGADWIATAHHADDRAETVVLRLLHGAAAEGLGVLPPHDGDLVRPLVRATRQDIEAHVARHEIPFATDPSNIDPHFMRTRVRSEVMPLLRALDPAITAHLCALADELGVSSKPAYAIPHKTRLALARLAATGNGNVLLPGGIQAMKAERSNAKKR